MYLHEVYFKGSSIRSSVICDVRVDLTFTDVRGCQIYLQSILGLDVTTSVSTSCLVASQPRNLKRFNSYLLNTSPLHVVSLPYLRLTKGKWGRGWRVEWRPLSHQVPGGWPRQVNHSGQSPPRGGGLLIKKHEVSWNRGGSGPSGHLERTFWQDGLSLA